MARLPTGIDGRAADTGPVEDSERGGGGGAIGDGADGPSSHDANSTSAAPPAPPPSRAGVETIDDEDPAPVPVMAAMLETTKGAAGEERRPAGVEQIEEEEGDAGAPSPPGSFAYALDDGAPKKVRANQGRQVDEEEMVVGPGECDGDLQFTTSSPRYFSVSSKGRGRDVGAAAEGEEDGASSVDTVDFEAPPGGAEDPEQADAPNASVYASGAEIVPMRGSDSVPGITEAYAVDDTVVIAEPQLPLWKQTKVRMILALFLVALAVLAIALGVTLSRDNVAQLGESESTLAPSISAYPTLSPVPSASPSECSYTVGSSRQTINLLSPGADKVRTALDGPNLVVAYIVASRYSDFGFIDEGAFYIEFFKLQNGVPWERVHYSIERNVDWEAENAEYAYFDVALSGNTAVIGLPSRDDMAGAVHVYQESVFGTWESVASPEPTSRIGACRFGESVDIDDDLLVVSDHHVCVWGAISVGPNAAYVFQQVGNEWKEVAVLDDNDWSSYGQGVVKGGTIAFGREDVQSLKQFVEVYTIDPPQNKSASHTQRLTPPHENIKTLAISGDHLVSLAGPKGDWVTVGDSEIWYEPVDSVFIYQREGVGESYSLLQSLYASDYDEGFGQAFALDGDMLVLGSSNQTHILSLQPSGRWEETLTLDQPYSHLQLSGRALVATSHENEVYSMDISDCTQPVPTQRPSISVAPSSSCHWVNVTIVIRTDLDWSGLGGYFGSWEAAIRTRELLESDAAIVMAFDDSSRSGGEEYLDGDGDEWWFENSTCLQLGEYEFVFHGETDHQGRFTDRYYRVESNGQLIAQEKVSFANRSDYEIDNIHPFDVPFVARGDSPAGAPLPPRPVPLTRPPSYVAPTVSASPTIDIAWRPSPTTRPTILPSAKAATGPSPKICRTRSECEEQKMQNGGFVGFYTGSYADYGCFSKGENLYWGIGGTEEQMAATPLAGAKERVWCGQV